jgi:hypothetical protein
VSEVPQLRVIDAGASPEEVAAIVAAVSVALHGGAAEPVDEAPSAWITASRLKSRRAGVRWGDWRWSDRLGGRVRA